MKKQDGDKAYLVMDTPVVNDKGQVVGTEARRYNLLKVGRNLVVEEEGSSIVPTADDAKDVDRFLKQCKGSPLEAAMTLVHKNADELARFRKQYRSLKLDLELIDLIKSSFQAAHLALGNWVSSVVYPLPEFLADEVHLATMGLSDNNEAICDVVASPSALLTQVSYFYGVKFGDGRYEVKSADGLGDRQKFLKDTRFAVRGRLQELVEARLSPTAEIAADEMMAALDSRAWDQVVAAYGTASEEQLAGWASRADLDAWCEEVADGSKLVQRALFARFAPAPVFWKRRLQEALSATPLNKRLLMRVAACNSPAQRKALAQDADLSAVVKVDTEETKFVKALFGMD